MQDKKYQTLLSQALVMLCALLFIHAAFLGLSLLFDVRIDRWIMITAEIVGALLVGARYEHRRRKADDYI